MLQRVHEESGRHCGQVPQEGGAAKELCSCLCSDDETETTMLPQVEEGLGRERYEIMLLFRELIKEIDWTVNLRNKEVMQR